jgi:hypothetical protein
LSGQSQPAPAPGRKPAITGRVLAAMPLGTVLALLAALALGAALLLAMILSPSDVVALFSETGPVEKATVALYPLDAGLLLFGPYLLPRSKWMPAAICLILMARELDLNELVTQGGFLFLPAGFKAGYPCLYAVIEATAVAGALALAIATVVVYLPELRRRHGVDPVHSRMLAAGWAFAFASMALDGIGNKLHDLSGVEIGEYARNAFQGFEETAELLIPVCFLFALLQYYKTNPHREAGR